METGVYRPPNSPEFGEDERYLALREELRWFTNQLGDARNLGVYLQREL